MVPGSPVRPSGEVMRTENCSSCARTWVSPPATETMAATSAHAARNRLATVVRLRVGRFSFAIVDEVARTRRLQDLRRQLRWLPEVLGQIDGLVDEIAGVAATQL